MTFCYAKEKTDFRKHDDNDKNHDNDSSNDS